MENKNKVKKGGKVNDFLDKKSETGDSTQQKNIRTIENYINKFLQTMILVKIS